MRRLALLLPLGLSLLLACGRPPAPVPEELSSVFEAWPRLQADLPTYRLTVSDADWRALHDHLYEEDYGVPGTFAHDGRTWPVTVGIRGHSSRHYPKKSLTIEFPDGDRFSGRKRLELNAQYLDGGLLTEKLWLDLAAAAGAHAPGAQYANLELNGSFYGVMTALERVDKSFLRARGLHEEGSIYRAGMFDSELRDGPGETYQDPWKKRTNEDQPFDELWSFLSALSRTPAHEFESMLGAHMDLERYLVWLAVDAAIANDLVMDARIFLIREVETGRWLYVPWDLNNANSQFNRTEPLENQWDGWDRSLASFTLYDARAYSTAAERTASGLFPDVRPAWSILATRLFDSPSLRARFVAALRHLLDTRFREEEIHPRIDAMSALLAPHVARDAHVDAAYSAHAPAFLKTFVTDRREYLLSELSNLERHGETAWKIDRVGLDAGGASFVQIVNASAQEQSPRGLWLTGRLRYPKGQALPHVAVPPGSVVTFSSAATDPALRLTIAIDTQRPEVGLFEADGVTAIDATFLAPLAPGAAYGRSPRGAESFASFTGPE